MKEKITSDKVKKITEEIAKDYDKTNVAKFLSSNEIEFEHEEKKYKVTKPTFAQKQQTYEAKNKKYLQLLNDDNYVLEEELKKTYLKKGVDINAIQTKIDFLGKEHQRCSFKLGEAVEKKLSEKEINLFEAEVTKIDDEIKELSVKKTDYLEYSIESQIIIFEYSYLVYLIAEKLDGELWTKVWNTYEDKISEKDESLINTVTFHSCFLLRGEV